MKNPVDEYFANDLENIEIAPSKNLWAEKIAPRVEGKEEVKPVFWYRVAAVAVILLSGWFAVNLLQPKQDQVQTLTIKKPIVLEQIEVKPTQLPTTILEPVQDLEVEMQRSQQVAEVDPVNPDSEEPTMEVAEEHVMLAQVDPEVVTEETPAAKPKVKVVLRLNSTEQAIASADVPAQSENTFGDYARTQWENVKQGEKIQAPEKLINWPKIKVEGNPLRGMFAAKGE